MPAVLIVFACCLKIPSHILRMSQTGDLGLLVTSRIKKIKRFRCLLANKLFLVMSRNPSYAPVLLHA